jgi:hypothetical protein
MTIQHPADRPASVTRTRTMPWSASRWSSLGQKAPVGLDAHVQTLCLPFSVRAPSTLARTSLARPGGYDCG